jgi:hypothetical protein
MAHIVEDLKFDPVKTSAELNSAINGFSADKHKYLFYFIS